MFAKSITFKILLIHIVKTEYNLKQINGIRSFLRVFFQVLCHIVLLFGGIDNQLFSQSDENEIEKAIGNLMVKAGYENVAVIYQDSSLMIGYENRRFRFEARALAGVVKLLSDSPDLNAKKVQVVVYHQFVPIILVDYNLRQMNNFIQNLSSDESFYQFMNVTLFHDDFDQSGFKGFKNKSFFKTDLVIIPNWKVQFGDFDRPVQSNINLIPEINATFSKGLSFKGQVIIPVQNNFYVDEEGKKVRPGNITLNQFVRLKEDFFISFTGGFFNLNRAGLNIDIKKYLLNGNLVLGAEAGFTGYHSFTSLEPEYYEDGKFLTAFLMAAYTYQPYDATGIIRVGNFLYNNPGIRVDVFRQFREVRIGFFALVSSGDVNGGFNFSIPLPPRKYCRLNSLRIRPSEDFQWEYKARGFPESGNIYTTEHSVFEIMLEYNPDFVKKQIFIELSNK